MVGPLPDEEYYPTRAPRARCIWKTLILIGLIYVVLSFLQHYRISSKFFLSQCKAMSTASRHFISSNHFISNPFKLPQKKTSLPNHHFKYRKLCRITKQFQYKMKLSQPSPKPSEPKLQRNKLQFSLANILSKFLP